MVDLASIGFSVDTSGLQRGERALDSFASSGRRASSQIVASLGDITVMNARVANSIDLLRDSVERGYAQRAVPAYQQGTTRATASTRQFRAELVNLSRQIQDVGVGLGSGQSPFTILIQQGPQIADILATSQRSAADFGRAILSVLTPFRLLLLGIGAVGGVVVTGVLAWKSYALAVDDAARSVNATTLSLARLQSSAAIKGIDATEFQAGIKRIAEQSYLAQSNVGQLAEFLRVNGVRAAKDFNGQINQIADILARARSDQERLVLLQRAGLPATMEWVRLLGGGSKALDDLQKQLSDVSTLSDDRLIKKAREFDEAWNRAWTNFGINARSAVMVALEGVQTLIDRSRTLVRESNAGGDPRTRLARALAAREAGIPGGGMTQAQIDQIYRSSGADARRSAAGGLFPGIGTAGPARDPVKEEQLRAQEMARLSTLGQLLTAEQAARQVQLQINQARQNGAAITREEEAALMNLARAQTEAAKTGQQVAFGIYDAGRQAQAAELQLRSLVDQGIITNAQQYADAQAVIGKRLRENAEAAAIARSPYEQLTRTILDASNANKQIDIAATSALTNIENSFVDIITASKSVSEAFRSMVTSILKDLSRLIVRQTIIGPLGNALLAGLGIGGGGGAGGIMDAQEQSNMLATLGHGGGMAGYGSHRRAPRSAYGGAYRYQTGGVAGFAPDEVPAILHRGEEVLTRSDPRHRYNGGAGGGVTINVQGNMDRRILAIVEARLGEIQRRSSMTQYRDARWNNAHSTGR